MNRKHGIYIDATQLRERIDLKLFQSSRGSVEMRFPSAEVRISKRRTRRMGIGRFLAPKGHFQTIYESISMVICDLHPQKPWPDEYFYCFILYFTFRSDTKRAVTKFAKDPCQDTERGVLRERTFGRAREEIAKFRHGAREKNWKNKKVRSTFVSFYFYSSKGRIPRIENKIEMKRFVYFMK